MNIKLVSRPAALVAILTFLGVAQAARGAELGFYVGGQGGTASRDVPIAVFDDFASTVYQFFAFTPQQSSSTFDDEDTTYGFLAGYRLTRFLAFEGAYTDIGSLKYRARNVGNFSGDPGQLDLNADSGSSGIAVSALGILPLTYRWEVYARVGVMFSTNDFKIFLSDGIDKARDESSESSNDYLAGIGATWSFLEIYNARLEFQRVFDAGSEQNGEGDADLISFGITVGF